MPGSALKMPAQIRPTLYTPNSAGPEALVCGCSRNTRRMPIEAAISKAPVTMKLAIWIRAEFTVAQQAERVATDVEAGDG